MGPGDVTSREAVLRAMREYDELGRDAFLAKYGFRRSTKFVVVHEGREYDSKALLAAAHGFQHPDAGPLLSKNFSGGDQTTSRLQALGFTITSAIVTSPDVRFSRVDCQVFERYPKSVPWRDEYVDPVDQDLFKGIWKRLARLADWLSKGARIDVSLQPAISRYQANGHTQKDIWCCIYPAIVPHKSYALQVALIISSSGAEVCLCVGAGRSTLHGPKLIQAEEVFQRMQERLASIPPSVVDKFAWNLPRNIVYRKSWRQPAGIGDFETLTDWLSYAASPEGAQSSISIYLDPDQLQTLGPQISDFVLQLADASAPLLEYCYPETFDEASSRDIAIQQPLDFDHEQASDGEEISVELDSLGFSAGVERELPYDDGDLIKEPFDPEKIDVTTRNPTVDLLLARIRRGVLDLQPEFQRMAGIWSEQNQSRLIESMLLRIPLPTFYAAEADDERWIIVDGVQRLTTIARFITPESINENPLRLRKLEYLRQYEGKRFADLPGRLQIRLVETELVLHLIRRGTPEPVMFNIFARINTGGRPLTRQELRHALIPGPARTLLREMAESYEFQQATLGTVSPERMDDREMALRFIAFWLHGPEQYEPDFDEFLRKAMHEVNRMGSLEVGQLREHFYRALDVAQKIFGEHAFRKLYPGQVKRSPINKALFEAISVNLARRSDLDLRILYGRRADVINRFATTLMDYPPFERAISAGTGDIGKVRTRFAVIDQMLREVTDA